ncbi:MAG: flagellar hook-basal body complex protein [Pseudomonadota bacterium]
MGEAVTAVLAGGLRLQRAQVDLTAHNMANQSTVGFRAQRPVASEHVYARAPASVSVVRLAAAMVDETGGRQTVTGAPLDLAIDGEGYFQVAGPDGAPLLTRAGQFERTAAGAIVAPDGAAVLDEGGAPLAIPADAASVDIARDGTITADGQPVGRVGVVTTEGALVRRVGARFAAEGPVVPVDAPRVRQGVLENANVDPIGELTRLIEASRRYEMLQGMVEKEDGRVGNLIETLSRVR